MTGSPKRLAERAASRGPVGESVGNKTARIGRNQLCLLATMGSPFSLLILRDKVSRSIEERGFLAPRKNNGLFGITPAGLRTLADALERGDLEPFFDGRFQDRDRVRIYLSGKADK